MDELVDSPVNVAFFFFHGSSSPIKAESGTIWLYLMHLYLFTIHFLVDMNTIFFNFFFGWQVPPPFLLQFSLSSYTKHHLTAVLKQYLDKYLVKARKMIFHSREISIWLTFLHFQHHFFFFIPTRVVLDVLKLPQSCPWINLGLFPPESEMKIDLTKKWARAFETTWQHVQVCVCWVGAWCNWFFFFVVVYRLEWLQMPGVKDESEISFPHCIVIFTLAVRAMNGDTDVT